MIPVITIQIINIKDYYTSQDSIDVEIIIVSSSLVTVSAELTVSVSIGNKYYSDIVTNHRETLLPKGGWINGVRTFRRTVKAPAFPLTFHGKYFSCEWSVKAKLYNDDDSVTKSAPFILKHS